MARPLSNLFPVIFDGFVALTMIAVVGTVATLLPYSSVHRKTTYVLAAFVLVLGIAAVGFQMRRLIRFDRARIRISRLLAEGQQLTLTIVIANSGRRFEDYPDRTVRDQADYDRMADWCRRVEEILRPLDESYVTRFHLGGSLQQDERSMTVWKTRHRLETLASFLLELK